ncbi:MAG: hypothetical protein HYT72_01870 [Candidatus Aenigmarchaeota archaeon]|nr:hypothetical protein [Candidatus Aenigmarchaeota archaeon]
MSVATELNPKARGEIEGILARDDAKQGPSYAIGNESQHGYRLDNAEKYTYKPTLDIFVTERYTADGAWAHTEPDRRVICIRPWERLDYDILLEHLLASVPMDLPFGPYALHEVAHNAHRDAGEGAIRRLTMDPNIRYVVNGFNLKYHGRN